MTHTQTILNLRYGWTKEEPRDLYAHWMRIIGRVWLGTGAAAVVYFELVLNHVI